MGGSGTIMVATGRSWSGKRLTLVQPFERILKLCGNDKKQAAWLLGVTLQTLESLLKQESVSETIPSNVPADDSSGISSGT